jgi:hypothetical protein
MWSRGGGDWKFKLDINMDDRDLVLFLTKLLLVIIRNVTPISACECDYHNHNDYDYDYIYGWIVIPAKSHNSPVRC